jgi:hypothetical protein
MPEVLEIAGKILNWDRVLSITVGLVLVAEIFWFCSEKLVAGIVSKKFWWPTKSQSF